MPTDIGIDISAFQTAWPNYDLFVVHKATEGHDYVDPQFIDRYPHLGQHPELYGLRGAYHYARPGDGFDGTAQANFFADTLLSVGFKPGVDLWQLDAEDGGNESVSPAQWAAFIDEFMATATQRLGGRGFLYAGWPFLEAHHLQAYVTKYHWWLPDYSVNDGAVHPVQVPAVAAPYVVLHQFTSWHIDQSVIVNHQTWNDIVGIDWKALQQIAAFIESVTKDPMREGEKSERVTELNKLLVANGAPALVEGDVYGERTRTYVLWFKALYGVPNRDGHYAGRTIVLALFKHAK